MAPNNIQASRRRIVQEGAAAAAATLAPGLLRPARAAGFTTPIKLERAVIGFAHVGPISDEGWTSTHHQGLFAVKKRYPQAKHIELESVPYSADATRSFRQFVAQGATMVFITSEYADLLRGVAEKAPDIAWMEIGGHTKLPNLSWYYVKHWLPTYVAGVAAGLMSKTGKLGYVGSFPVPVIYCGVNAFLMGARSVNPNATMQVILIDSWFNPQDAAQAGTAPIDNGCDFLFGIMDEAAYLQVAERRGVSAAMWNTDVRRYGQKAYVTSIRVDWDEFYVARTMDRIEGKWRGDASYLLDMGKGVDVDRWGESVPERVRLQANAVRTKILGGFDPFVGDIKDSAGRVRVPKGQGMSDMDLYEWDWPMEGVSGLRNA